MERQGYGHVEARPPHPSGTMALSYIFKVYPLERDYWRVTATVNTRFQSDEFKALPFLPFEHEMTGDLALLLFTRDEALDAAMTAMQTWRGLVVNAAMAELLLGQEKERAAQDRREAQRLKMLAEEEKERRALDIARQTPDAVLTAYRCPECEELFDTEPEIDPRYECGSCGNEFSRSEEDSHRCPQCGKFGAKVAESTCQSCGVGVDEFEEVSCVEVDGELVALSGI